MGRRASRGLFFVNLLGGFQVAGPTATEALLLERRKTCALLALLARDPGHSMARGKLTTLLWGEQSEDAARHALRQCLLDLRQVLTKAKVDALRVEADLIGLDTSTVVVDATCFERHAARGTPEALKEAAALYRGDLLEGFGVKEPAFEDWLRGERERLRSRAIGVMKSLLSHYQKVSNLEEAIQVAIRLLALEPFDEAAHRALMQLYAANGRRSAALRQYEDCVELLGRELGVEPEAETRALYRRLLAERPRAPVATTPGRLEPSRAPRSIKSRFAGRSPAEAALVGRRDDLAWLEEFVQRARRGQPHVVLLFGEAGIGKSRLIGELDSRAQRRHTDVLIGRSREGEDVLPFAPWIEALRPALTRLLIDRLPAVTRTDLTRLFIEFAGQTIPPPTGIDDGPRIFEAVAHLLRELSASRPIVVVLEDLHWCDDMTVRLLRFLPRRLEGRRVLLIGTARPEDLADAPARTSYFDILRLDPSCASRTLTPLSRDDAKRLFVSVTSRTGALSEVLIERVWAISEGNPFVVVECARAMRERHADEPDRLLDLPEGVRTLTTRSLARLSEDASRLVDVAAVVGRDIDVRILQHAAQLTEPALADVVEELVRRRVLREIDGRFDFSHDRVREVAYRRLLGPRRVLLHRQVGEALETVYGDRLGEYYGMIAPHCRQACDWPKACRYYARAGFFAFERGAGREALTCFDYALDAISRLPDTDEWRLLDVQLRIAANGASMMIGNYEGGWPYLRHAEHVAKTLSDPRWEARVAIAASSCVRAAGKIDQALTFGRRALKIAEETREHSLQATAKFVLGLAEHNVGNFRRALEHLEPLMNETDPEWNETFLERPQNVATIARYWTVFCCVQLGEFDRAGRLVEDGLRLLDVQTDVFQTQALYLHITHGRLLNAIGQFEAAVRAYEAGFAVYREDCHGNFYYALAWGRGLAYALAGRVNESLEQFQKAEAVAVRRGTRPFTAMWLLHFGRALLNAGRVDDAAQMAHDAFTTNSKNGKRPSEAAALGLLADVAMRREPLPASEIEELLLKALTLAEPLEMRPLAARCHLRLASLYARLGRADAHHHRAVAESLLDQMGRPRSLEAAGVH